MMIFPDAMIYLNVFRQIKQFPNHIKTKQNLDCNFTLSNDLAPNGIPFVAKSIRKVKLQSKFGLI